MKEMITLLQKPSTFLLLLAPPGWGKTSLIIDLYLDNDVKLVYLSPLRAIAEEFYNRCSKIVGVQRLANKKECGKKVKIFLESKKSLLISTCELLDDYYLDELSSCKGKVIFILDEFHLFYYWGETFREKLLETYHGICSTKASVLAMTATMDSLIYLKFIQDIQFGMDNLYCLDLGNQILKNLPFKNHFFLVKKNLMRRFYYELGKKKNGTILFFCKYRQNVDWWLQYSKVVGINALGCVGGQAQEFIESLKQNPNPKCIFATSVLGHGVNLPQISKVFIDYKVSDKDFYIQMVGRGGRQGESFEVFSRNQDIFSSKKELLVSFLKAFLFDILYLGLFYGKQSRRIINLKSSPRRTKYYWKASS